jgi:hypothetical protein
MGRTRTATCTQLSFSSLVDDDDDDDTNDSSSTVIALFLFAD